MNIYGYNSYTEEVLAKLTASSKENLDHYGVDAITADDVTLSVTDIDRKIGIESPLTILEILGIGNSDPSDYKYRFFNKRKFWVKRRTWAEIFPNGVPIVRMPNDTFSIEELYVAWADQYGQNNLLNDHFPQYVFSEPMEVLREKRQFDMSGGKDVPVIVDIGWNPNNPEWFGNFKVQVVLDKEDIKDLIKERDLGRYHYLSGSTTPPVKPSLQLEMYANNIPLDITLSDIELDAWKIWITETNGKVIGDSDTAKTLYKLVGNALHPNMTVPWDEYQNTVLTVIGTSESGKVTFSLATPNDVMVKYGMAGVGTFEIGVE